MSRSLATPTLRGSRQPYRGRVTDVNPQELASLAAAIRVLSAEAVEKAQSGHPGMPMGAADMAAVLWSYYLRFNPEDPGWIGRDRFVLSAGHGSMLLYSLLHLFGYDLSLEDIRRFRQSGSKTPGHPEVEHTVGVETTTGPLGQGFANGVGLALSAKMLGGRYPRELFDYRVFGIVSDGDLMEGVSSEAASLAGHWRLGNLIYLYDDNRITIGGSTGLCFTEDVAARFEAYDWYVQRVDGHDVEEIAAALDRAVAQDERPCLICAKTTIGQGSPSKAGTPDCHGAPLGAAEVQALKAALGWPERLFFVPPEVYAACAERVEEKRREYQVWTEQYARWQQEPSADAEAWNVQRSREIPAVLREELVQELGKTPVDATRNISGKAIQIIARHLPWFLGGSADLEPSNKTLIKDSCDLTAPDYKGRNIRFGVREHAMGAITNGLAYSRAFLPYCATFLVFADYMRPAIRMAALAKLQTLFIFSHDSFYVGEDGPTHQPIEQINSLRMIPNVRLFRPADGLETALCYWQALRTKDGPSILLFSRQKPAALKREEALPADVSRGAYIVSGAAASELVIVATGTEVPLAVEAGELLRKDGREVRVVSMPCVELFLKQEPEFRDSLLPPSAKKVSLEAGSIFGWERIVGAGGLCIGIDDFGTSAPAEVLAEQLGFTPKKVAEKISTWLANQTKN